MSGGRSAKIVLNFLRRREFILTSAVAGIALCSLITYAMLDFVRIAKVSERRVQSAVLAGELANFLLAVQDEEGATLLDNPNDSSRATRPIGVSSLRRPFFRYFLTHGNARQFKVDDLTWEPPRSCVTRFESRRPQGKTAPFLEACFATVQSDPTGRYIYFALKFPSEGVARHRRGSDPMESDQVRLLLAGDRSVDTRLVFETPTLAQSRYPSQLSRFSSIHEVTAYGGDGQPFRALSAQAYERVADEGAKPTNVVTILGRLDAASVIDVSAAENWPSQKSKSVRVGVELRHRDETLGKSVSDLELPPGSLGTAAMSIERAYLSQVPSKSNLTVKRVGPKGSIVWTSASLPSTTLARSDGWLQTLSDWWASKLIDITDETGTAPLRVTQSMSGHTGIEAILQAEPVRLPDIATRAFLFLSLALLLVLVLGFIWLRAIWRLQLIAIASYRMTTKPSMGASLQAYALRKDEVGRLARILDLLIKRSRFKDMQMVYRRSTEVRTAVEQVKLRQAILEAIGHEIRSPLQSLIARSQADSPYNSDLARMARAVNTLYDATSVESGLQSGRVVLERLDIAEHLSRYAENLTAAGHAVRYVGRPSNVFALFDQINFDQVLQHVVENALRYKNEGTSVEIRLGLDEIAVRVEIVNEGRQIEIERLEKIFDLGESTRDGFANRGQGLFVARSHMAGMQGSIRARNLDDGVCFTMELAVASWSSGVPRAWLREFRNRTSHIVPSDSASREEQVKL